MKAPENNFLSGMNYLTSRRYNFQSCCWLAFKLWVIESLVKPGRLGAVAVLLLDIDEGIAAAAASVLAEFKEMAANHSMSLLDFGFDYLQVVALEGMRISQVQSLKRGEPVLGLTVGELRGMTAQQLSEKFPYSAPRKRRYATRKTKAVTP